jgi:hypothetical protein
MSKDELWSDVLKGFLLIVAEYRGSHAELAGYVCRKTGAAKQHVRATHLAECAWCGNLDRVVISQYFAPDVTLEQAKATLTYTRGQLYVFYIEWFKRERGQTSARLSPWGIEPIEEEKEAAAAPAGAAPPF